MQYLKLTCGTYGDIFPDRTPPPPSPSSPMHDAALAHFPRSLRGTPWTRSSRQASETAAFCCDYESVISLILESAACHPSVLLERFSSLWLFLEDRAIMVSQLSHRRWTRSPRCDCILYRRRDCIRAVANSSSKFAVLAPRCRAAHQVRRRRSRGFLT